MGGARALEWIVGHPDTVRPALVLAVGARATADQIGTQSTQIAAIKADPDWQGGDYYGTGRSPDAGMEIARRFAHLTYRGEVELDTRFGNDAQGDEDPRDRRPLRGAELPASTRATSCWRGSTRARYVALTEALSSHDVGRGRGGVEAALRGLPGAGRGRRHHVRPALSAAPAGGTGRAAAGLRRAERRRLDLRPRRIPGRDRGGRRADPRDPGVGRRGDRVQPAAFAVVRRGGRGLRTRPAVVPARGHRLAAARRTPATCSTSARAPAS